MPEGPATRSPKRWAAWVALSAVDVLGSFAVLRWRVAEVVSIVAFVWFTAGYLWASA